MDLDRNPSLRRYPKELAGGLRIRPLVASDEPALLSFFKGIPIDERQLFKDGAARTSVIRGWVRNLDYRNVLPLLSFDGSRLVADATLHRSTRGWGRHVATLRLTLHPEYRRRGLARALVREFMELAGSLGITILQAEILDLQKEARRLFESLGFKAVATLPQHAIDLCGRVHDVLIYALTVTPPLVSGNGHAPPGARQAVGTKYFRDHADCLS